MDVQSEIQIAWNDVEDDDRDTLIDFLKANGYPLEHRRDEYKLRQAERSFYPALIFLEVQDLRSGSSAYLFIDPEKDNEDAWFSLDLTNHPIYSANKEYLLLNENTVLSYAAFFFSAVAGPYGLMPMIERLAPFTEAGAPEEDMSAELEKLQSIVPPRVLGEYEDRFEIGAALLFEGAVFKTLMVIQRDGVVSIRDHELAFSNSDADPAASQDSSETVVPGDLQ